MYCWPAIVYGTKVRTGAAVSYRPCDACQIWRVAPLSAVLKGYGIERSADDHSSFDRPATIRLPLMNAMSVMVCVRGFCRPVGLDAGASFKLTAACLTLSSDSMLTLPEASTRTMSGIASGPRPRDADR